MRKININKPNGLGVIGAVITVTGALLGIASSVVNDRKNQAYLDKKFEDWAKNINQK